MASLGAHKAVWSEAAAFWDALPLMLYVGSCRAPAPHFARRGRRDHDPHSWISQHMRVTRVTSRKGNNFHKV
jgi:hypothetical protein